MTLSSILEFLRGQPAITLFGPGSIRLSDHRGRTGRGVRDVGYQAGPRFIEVLKTQGPRYFALALLVAGMAGAEKSLMAVMAVAHSGMTTEEFDKTVKDWLATAKHPKTDQPYNSMVYQPVLEVFEYLRANGFKTFIVSGGGVEFMRVLVKLSEVQFIDDKEGKPIGIQTFIGRRPRLGHSDGDE